MSLCIEDLHIGRTGDPAEIRGCRRWENDPCGDTTLKQSVSKCTHGSDGVSIGIFMSCDDNAIGSA